MTLIDDLATKTIGFLSTVKALDSSLENRSVNQESSPISREDLKDRLFSKEAQVYPPGGACDPDPFPVMLDHISSEMKPNTLKFFENLFSIMTEYFKDKQSES